MNFKHLLAMTFVAGMVLTGCSSQSEEQAQTPETEVVTETPEATETTTFTGEAISETPVGGDSTDVVVTTITYDQGKPVNVVFDVKTDAGSKREASEAGTYDMGGDLAWHEQMDALQAFIVEKNFDLEQVTLTDEAGHTDAITGVSITVGSYLPLVEELMASVENGTYQAPAAE